MIVYGTKGKLLKADYIADSCPNCNTHNTMQMNVFQRWAHIFWIPFFPVGKTGVSQCTNCRQVLKLKQMPPSLRMSYDNMKSQTSTPIWTFSGIGLVILIAIGVTISQRQTVKKVNQMVLAPQKNDIFEIKLKDDHYTLIKIDKVLADSVYFFANKYETDRSDGISDLSKSDTAFDAEPETLSRPALIAMAKREEILDIDRK